MGSIFSCQNHPLFLLDSWHILYRKNLIWGLYLAAKFILKVAWSVKGVILFFFFFWLLQCLLFEWSMMINPKACFSKNIRSGRLRAFASPGSRANAAPILPWMSETYMYIILHSIGLFFVWDWSSVPLACEIWCFWDELVPYRWNPFSTLCQLM